MGKRLSFDKRLASIVLAAAMVFTSMPDRYLYAAQTQASQVSAEENDADVLYLKDKGEVSEYGYQDTVWVDRYGNETRQENEHLRQDSGLSGSSGDTLPLSYSMVDEGLLPTVRNQGQYGTCWAHASICAMETNMIKKGLADVNNVDYSERHLAYFSHRRNETLGDGADSYDSTGGYGWYGGGSYREAVFEFSSWYGAAEESDYPYMPYSNMEDLDEGSRSSSVCHLTDAYELSTAEEVKSAVMENGSVICSYYADDTSIDNNNYAVYHTENPGTNHVVSVVGWDDEYKASNFSGSENGSTPSSDGAWLCRNSWGSSWGNNGYFWISYEDASLGYFCSFEAEAKDNYDNIYQYDGAGYRCRLSYNKSANIFTADSLEELKAVSFYIYSDCNYVIDIYAEGEDPMAVPSDGMLIYSQKGTVERPGYHTIELDKGIIFDTGVKYAVSVKLDDKNGGNEYNVFAEQGDDYSYDSGQSFVYTGANEWKDTKEVSFSSGDIKNVCIKAFTNDLENVDISELKTDIDTAEKLNSEDYTASSWTRLTEKLEEARSVYNMENPAASDIIRAKYGIESAISGLVLSKVYIGSEEEYEAFAESITAGTDYEGQTVYLTKDLDLTGVAHSIAGYNDKPFMGTFDGGGHSISNLEFSYKYSYGGLFSRIGEKGMIKNLNLMNVKANYAGSYSGGLAAINDGTITGCTVEGELVFGSAASGGIVGVNNGTIEESHLTGTVTFTNQSGAYSVGGIAANNKGTISKCYTQGLIASDGSVLIGGIAGYSDADSVINQCYNLAVISGNPTEDTMDAGIAVYIKGDAKDCYNYGSIERRSSNTAALYIYNSGNISNCYYLGSSSETGGYSPSSDEGSLTEEDFASGKAAYYLNSSGETGENNYNWSDNGKYPVHADNLNKPVIRVKVEQNNTNQYKASLNGITEGVLYGKAGTKVVLKAEGSVDEGYTVVPQAAGLELSEDGDGTYILPDKDTSVVITSEKQCIDYNVTFNLNRGSGVSPCTYNIETSLELPVPVKKNADFLGWYDNKEFNGEPVTEIKKGDTGDKEFWAKWDNHGFRVIFPQGNGYDIVSCEGYDNGCIQEGESYLFTINPQKGYDISGLTVKYGENELVPSDGVYRIDNIFDDITDISISGVRLAAGNYQIEGSSSANGYVGMEAVVLPVYPAVKIMAEGGAGFAESITVDTDKDIRVVMCDEEGNESEPETIVFKRDITKPSVNSASISFVDDNNKYKGVYLAIEAEDSQSGVADYSFDNGITWQQDNRFHIDCMETETVFDNVICVRDNVGNVAEYVKEFTIPAVEKVGSSINLYSDRDSYPYGADITLTAEIVFDKYVPDVTDYGYVVFSGADGNEIGRVDAAAVTGTKVKAQIIIPSSVYSSIGKMEYSAQYKGLGTPYRDSSCDKYAVNVVKAKVLSVNTAIPETKSVSAADKYTMQQLISIININEVEAVTDSGIIYTLPVTWHSSDEFNPKGGTYSFTGAISGNEYVEVAEGFSPGTKVIVEPVILELPSFNDISMEQVDKEKVPADELGEDILPLSGKITVSQHDINYRIEWDKTESINAMEAGSFTVFNGRVSFADVPDWITIPEYDTVTRKVTVEKSGTIGTDISISLSSGNYVEGDDIVFAAEVSAITGQPLMPDESGTYGKVYLYIRDEAGKVYVADCKDMDSSGKVKLTACRVSGKYTGYKDAGSKTFYAVYEYGGRSQSLWGSTSDNVKVIISKKPSAPVLSSAVKVSKNSVSIKWGRVKGAAGYEVYRKSGSGQYKKYKTVKGEKNVTLVNKGLGKNGRYYYKVRAYVNGSNGKAYSGFSSAKNVSMVKMISADELKLNVSKVKLKVKKSKTVKVVYPKGRSKSQIKTVKYKVSNSRVAKVNPKGKITAKKKGKAYLYVTVKLKNGQTKKIKAKVMVV